MFHLLTWNFVSIKESNERNERKMKENELSRLIPKDVIEYDEKVLMAERKMESCSAFTNIFLSSNDQMKITITH